MAYLYWRNPNRKPYSLPENFTRLFIPSPGGELELVAAEPPPSYTGSRKTALFFQHGGTGHAGVWIEWMNYFSQKHNIPCYAISDRGHGFSWLPSFIRMVYFTTKRDLANDMVTGVRYAEKREEESSGAPAEVIIVGHSSGGGLAQIILDAGNVKAKALVLVAAIPCYGSFGVYWRWWKMDPWFNFRMFIHFWHPNSPLSNIRLVKQAFFCREKPDEEVDAFARLMAPYESFLWPIGMMFKGYVSVPKIIESIVGWGTSERIFILSAENDALMSVKQMRGAAEHYRVGVADLVKEKKLEAKTGDLVLNEKTTENDGNGVRFRIVPGAGHHVQNDIQWEDGAKAVVEFYEQL